MSHRKDESSKQETEEAQLRALLCSFPGCAFRWSVKIDRPMCSYHQWGKGPYTETTETPAQREIKAGLKAFRPKFGEAA